MRRCFALPGLVLVAIAFSPLSATLHAEEPTPGEGRYVAQMAELPVPSSAFAMDIEAPLFTWEGKPLGTFTLQARPARPPQGEAVWIVSEKIVLTDTPHYWSEVATLDRYLRPLRGEAGGNRPKMRPYKVTWQETDGGYHFSREFVAGDRTITETATIDRPRPVTATLASLCLFCRMTLPKEGTFEVGMLSPDADQEKNIVQRAMWTQGATSKWQGAPSLVMKGARNDKNLIEMHFHPETRTLLGIRFGRGAQGFRGEVRVPQAAPAVPHATTAREAANRGVIGFATGDLDLLAQTLHWPSLHAAAKAAHDAEHAGEAGAPAFQDLEAYRAARLAGLSETLTKRPKAMIEMGLKGAAGQVTQKELEGGVIRFTYPALFRNMTVDVAPFAGAWYVVAWPGTAGG